MKRVFVYMTLVIVCVMSFSSCKKNVMKDENVVEMFSKLDELKFSNTRLYIKDTLTKVLDQFFIMKSASSYFNN